MKRIQTEAQEHLAPNLIPAIDIIFLLLLFFLLGSDLTQRDLEAVRLPNADEAKKGKPEARDGRLTIHACHLERTPALPITSTGSAATTPTGASSTRALIARSPESSAGRSPAPSGAPPSRSPTDG